MACSRLGTQPIYLDSRVGGSGQGVHAALPGLLQELGAPIEVTRLEYGDVSFLGRGRKESPVTVGVEIKTISDLLGSMRSGRLVGHQLPGLVQAYQQPWLVVEGITRVNRQTRVLQQPRGRTWQDIAFGRPLQAQDLWRYLITLRTCAGLHYHSVRSRYEVALFVLALYHWWTDKSLDAHRAHLGFARMIDPVLLREPSFARKFAALLPGVGWERSKAITETFVTVKAMVAGTVAEWAEVEGIGPVLAERIVGTIRGDSSR